MKKRNIIALLVSVLLLLGLVGCGASAKAEDSMEIAPDYDYMENGYGAVADGMVKEEASESGTTNAALPENRKLIQTVNMNVETEDLDGVLQQIDERIAQLGGYVESSNVYNGSAYGASRYRSASMTVRIPAKDLNAFVDRVGEVTNIVSSRKTVDDVTLSYVATESRMKALQTEEARLLELLAQAETMEDLLTVESRLTDVRTELEEVTSALRVFDNQVDYATIHLEIEEVKEYTEVREPETVWQRIGAGFTKSLKGVGNFLKELFVFLIVASPYLVLVGVIALGVFLIVMGSIRRRRRKRAKERENKA